MKLSFAILITMIILSCKSQTKTDLVLLKLNSSLPAPLLQNKDLRQDTDPNLGLAAITTDKLDGYTIGDIKLNTYAYPNGNLADHSNLLLLVSSKQSNNYLGFNYSSVNQEETKKIIAYLKKNYPNYQQSDAKGNGESFFWDISKLNAWIFTYQGISTDKNGGNFLTTNFIFIRKGTRIGNSDDSKVVTIKDYYKMMYPDLIK